MRKIPVRSITTASGSGSGYISVRSLASIQQGGALQHTLHRHTYFFILLVQTGKGIHTIDFTRYPVKQQSVYILRPGQVHELSLEAGAIGYILEFESSFYQPADVSTSFAFRKAVGKNYCKVSSARFKKLINLVTDIRDELAGKYPGYDAYIKNCLANVFIELNRQSTSPNRISERSQPYQQDLFERFRALLEQTIAEQKPVNWYAQQLHLSPFQLNKLTSTMTGQTVSQFVNDQLVLEAKRQLLATSSQVKEIAGALGFEDPSYFIRFFRKQTGFAPEAFRQHFK